MEKGEKNQRACKSQEADLFLKWGIRKRLRCVRVRDRPQISSYGGDRRVRRRITSSFFTFSDKDTSSLQPFTRHTRNSEATTLESENNRKLTAVSPERNGKLAVENGGGVVWPKLYLTLTSKEKEEDFMAMKGCKLPHRPKKRPKTIQRTLLLVSPGAWLSDMCQERYEVREKKKKKSTKNRPRGLKAMESDSE